LDYIVTSDIHLGHSKTPTEHIIESFKSTILTDSNKTKDVLFIAGDLFDRLLDLNTLEVKHIIEFFNYLLNYCYDNDILLRVLEGTPSHDWQQSSILLKLNDIRPNKCDFKYFKVLDVEYIEKFNKHILYIPDEWTNDHSTLETQITDKLNQYSITNVDIAILHGQFKYQFQGKPYHGFYFKEEYFLNLVRGYIHIGHYHVYTRLDRIIANGSLERLAHGEEKPKGYVVVKDNLYTFIENTRAFIYTTISITKKTSLDRLDKLIRSYPKGSYIRLLLSKDHPFNINFNDIKLRYLDYNLKKLVKESITEDNSITYIFNEEDIELSNNELLDTNIYDLLTTSILSKYDLDISETKKYLNYVDVFKQEIIIE
jgi:DNA repair exonuclease SbcCD nuclease subunit